MIANRSRIRGFRWLSLQRRRAQSPLFLLQFFIFLKNFSASRETVEISTIICDKKYLFFAKKC